MDNQELFEYIKENFTLDGGLAWALILNIVDFAITETDSDEDLHRVLQNLLYGMELDDIIRGLKWK